MTPFQDFFNRLRADGKPDLGLLARLSELGDYGVFANAGKGQAC